MHPIMKTAITAITVATITTPKRAAPTTIAERVAFASTTVTTNLVHSRASTIHTAPTAMSANSCQTASRRAPASIAVIRAIKLQTAPVAWYAPEDLAKFRAIAVMTALSETRASLASVAGIAIRN